LQNLQRPLPYSGVLRVRQLSVLRAPLPRTQRLYMQLLQPWYRRSVSGDRCTYQIPSSMLHMHNMSDCVTRRLLRSCWKEILRSSCAKRCKTTPESSRTWQLPTSNGEAPNETHDDGMSCFNHVSRFTSSHAVHASTFSCYRHYAIDTAVGTLLPFTSFELFMSFLLLHSFSLTAQLGIVLLCSIYPHCFTFATYL
jgi:hypothetical protein